MTHKKRHRILLIDDQESIHDDYRKVLGAPSDSSAALSKAAAALFGDEPSTHVDWEGFEIDSAFQGQQGFELVQQSINEGRPYALAFVDIRMPPGWDGVQTIQRIWEVDPEILIVICSAYSDYSWEEMVGKLGRNDRFLILKKPFDNIEVRQCAMALAERWSVSRTDVLTGLLNRRAFQGHLNLEWTRSQRYEFPMSCVMVDLDYFKRVNDTLGHHAGDLVLQAIARRLQGICRGSDCVCRYGGEEICVFLPHTDEAGAATWAEHARGVIEGTAVEFGDKSVQITASFGVSERLPVPDCAERLIDRADQALLAAKTLGRNRVTRFSAVCEPGELTVPQGAEPSNVFQGVMARHVMTAPVAHLPLAATAGEAAQFFLQFRINSAPVVDTDGKLAGILSEKDVIGILLNQNAWDTPIESIMQRNVVCYDEDAPVQSICEFLSRMAVRRVVIVRNGQPVGVVSRGSLLRWYSNWIRLQNNASSDDQPANPYAFSRGQRAHVVQGAEAVAQCANRLSENVAAEFEDLVPPVIEGVSRLQELINDLLTSSRPSTPAFAFDSSVLLRAMQPAYRAKWCNLQCRASRYIEMAALPPIDCVNLSDWPGQPGRPRSTTYIFSWSAD